MKQIIFAAVLAITFGMTLGFPVFTCDKLKDVEEGADNHDQYLVKLKDTNNYVDAQNLIDVVKQYQTTLEMYASNVHESSIKSELELSENAGVLHGTLSQQALLLVCLESSVESIMPDYPKPVVIPEGSGESVVIDCPKLILDGSQPGNDYSIAFKPKTTTRKLYHIIIKMQLAKQSDDTISFKYHYSVRKGKQYYMITEMNAKALEMVCNEAQVTEIKPNHDISVINKRDAADVSEQDTTTPGPCDLPEHKDEFPNIIFTYKVGADLDAIKETVEKYTENSAEVQSAIVLDFLDMIIFKMNRAAYLQACTNPEVTLVEYEKFIAPVGHCSLPERDEEFSRYIFVYNKGADVEAIKQSVEEDAENSSAQVKSAQALGSLDMIYFEMNRAAYLQACANTEITSVEYDGEITITQPQPQPQPQNSKQTDVCKQIDSLPDTHETYIALIKTPDTVEGRESRCPKLIQKLENNTAKSGGTMWYLTSNESCQTSGTEVTLTARLNVEALKYMCGLKGLDISVVQPPPCTGFCVS